MKRGAEAQLTKDSVGGDSRDDDDEPGTGMKVASADELSRRKIRALPKRMGGTPSAASLSAPQPPSVFGTTSTPTASAGTPAPTSLFGMTPASNSVFGSPSGGPKPFGFAPTSTSQSTPPPSFNFSPSASASSSAPPAASATSKMFESILTKTAPSPTPSATPSSTPSFSRPAINEPLVEVYKKLRGLNISLSETVKKSLEEDAFTDLSGIFDKYKVKRTEVQIELDKIKGKEAKAESTSSGAEPAPSKPPTLPPAPTTFAGFGGKSFTPPIPSVAVPSTTTTKPLFPEFKPPSTTSTFPEFKPPTTTSSGFEFKPLASAGSLGDKPTETEKDKATTNGASTSTTSSSSFFGKTAEKSSSSFTFGSSTPATSAFGSSSTAPASSNFFSGLSKPAGETAPAPSGFFSLAPKPAEGSSTTSTNFFGGSAFGKPATSTTTPATNFFGTSSSAPAPLFGSKPGTGFQFGAPAAPTPTETKPATTDSAPAGTGGEGSNSARSTPATDAGEAGDDGLGLNTPNPHDLEGKGEEDEETVHSVKLKAYRLKKDENGANKWAELGLGFLRLKKHKETGDRRVLLRNTANGRILINFRIYSGLSPALMGTKKGLTFIGHDEGNATSYLVRLANEEATVQLKAALDREIEFVKGKSSDS